MQFRDLSAQYAALKEKMDAALLGVAQSSRYILGPQVEELERRLAEYVGVKYCVSCANGTDALIMPLMAWGIGKGDAVFAPDFTYFASINCAMGLGASPVLVDIDSRTFNMSPKSLEAAIVNTLDEGRLTPRAIIPVDLFGLPADYDEILRIAKKYGLLVLEDAAQGFGGMLRGRRAGSFGDAAGTSFFPAKPLGCYGDGGAVFTNDAALAESIRSLRAQGRSPEDKYDNRTTGINSRLDTIQAAVLLVKLDAFEEYELDAVNAAAKKYDALLSDTVVTPLIPDGYLSSFAQYTIMLNDRAERDGLAAHLKQKGIPSMVYYPRGMHEQTAAKVFGCDGGSFQNSERAVATCLSLPMHPYLTDETIETVAGEIKSFLKK